ncbi:hypothetical protein [Methanoplanus limicola]|uniref:hypothetical protein n=1 Tax=Methanoplanus limicola TaxID=2315 RepID=UPI0012F70551|nr:hypothetical protein [Methanoplanus limicola]
MNEPTDTTTRMNKPTDTTTRMNKPTDTTIVCRFHFSGNPCESITSRTRPDLRAFR